VNTIVVGMEGINSRGVENSIPSIDEITAMHRRRDLTTDPLIGKNCSSISNSSISISTEIDRSIVMRIRQLLRTDSKSGKSRQMKIETFSRHRTFQAWEGGKQSSSKCRSATGNQIAI
jgi:hypothetical protein